MVSHVPAWLCGPAKLSKLALLPPLSIWENYASIDDDIEDDGKTIQTLATCLDEYTCYFKMLFKSQEERDEMIRMALSNFPTLFGKSNLAIQLDQLVSISNDTLSLYTHLRAHETKAHLVCRLLLEKKQPK